MPKLNADARAAQLLLALATLERLAEQAPNLKPEELIHGASPELVALWLRKLLGCRAAKEHASRYIIAKIEPDVGA